jgi:Txe/YoeB family toxin of Txe-Axe toxin-antitoxin module
METPQHSKLLHSLQNWKAKALARRQENKALKKRIGELIQSRDAWKIKAQTYQQALSDLQTQCSPEKKRSRPV